MERGMRFVLVLALAAVLFLAAAPPPAQAQASDVSVCSGCAFTSIQAAIEAVASGGTVHVADGTYTESLTIDRSLTLVGAGSATTIKGTVDVSAADVTLQDLTVDGPTGAGSGGYIVRLNGANGTRLQDCVLTSLEEYDSSSGLWLQSTSNATIQNVTVSAVHGAAGVSTYQETIAIRVDGGGSNTFDNVTIGDITSTRVTYGLKLAGPSPSNTITDLTIDGITASTVGFPAYAIHVTGGSGQYLDGVAIGRLSSPSVFGVYFSGVADSTLKAVRFAYGGGPVDSVIGFKLTGTSSGIAIQESEASHCTTSVLVDGGSATITNCFLADSGLGVGVQINGTAVLHECSLAGNTQGVSTGGSSASVDASSNWWGSASGPTHGSNPGGAGVAVSSRVTFSPWLGAGEDTDEGAPGFQPHAGPLYGIPTRIVFSAQPGGAAPGSPLAPQPEVQAQDAAGHLGYNFSGTVSLALGSNPTSAALSGTSAPSAAQGTASFADLAVSKAGTGYTLVASATLPAAGASPVTATSDTFDVADPPAISALTPDHATAGAAALDVVLTGSGFALDSSVLWNESPRITTYGSATQLTARIGAADLAAAGTATVTVANPNGQTSNAQAFTIRPVPAQVYVDAVWAATPADADPDGAGPATHLGYDAFATLQEALSAAAPGGTVRLAAGSYDGGLEVGVDGLTIDLNGAIVGHGSPAFTVTADDVTIEDGTFDGAGAAPGESAIVVNAGVARLWVHDCEIKGWPGDGFHLEGAVAGLKIMDNYIHDNTGDGVELAVAPTGTVVISGNSFRGNGGSGIHAAAGSVPAEHNEWGHIDGPAAGDGVTGAVDADPWLFGRVYADVAPSPAQVRETDAFDVHIKVDAWSLYGAQLELAFPAGLLQVEGMTLSGPGYLETDPAAVVESGFDNTTGTVTYHHSRQAGASPLSGSGTLLTIRFRAQDVGGAASEATIDIAAASVKLAAPGGIGIHVDSMAGDTVAILGTVSQVSGVVTLQGRGDWSGATVDAQPGEAYGADPAPVTSDAWGRFAFGATDDDYLVAITMPRYLPASRTVAVAGGSQELPAVELLGGDIDGVPGIDIVDITGISGVLFGAAVDAATTAADINYDGWVDILDLVLAAGNYGLTASPWEG